MRWSNVSAALVAATAGFGVALVPGVRAEVDEEHEDEALVELEDVEGVLEAMEALAPGLVPPAKAMETALARSPGVPVEVGLGSAQREGKRVAVWEVEILDGKREVEIAIDARTGDVVAEESEDEAVGEEALARLRGGDVTLASAAAAVATSFEGAVVAAEAEIEDGRLVFEVVLLHDGRVREIVVDGKTSKLSVDDDEDDEHDAGEDDGAEGDD